MATQSRNKTADLVVHGAHAISVSLNLKASLQNFAVKEPNGGSCIGMLIKLGMKLIVIYENKISDGFLPGRCCESPEEHPRGVLLSTIGEVFDC
jgi:hypothetical protein